MRSADGRAADRDNAEAVRCLLTGEPTASWTGPRPPRRGAGRSPAPWYRLNHAYASAHRGDWAEAVAMLSQVLDEAPRLRCAALEARLGEFHVARAEALLKAGRYEEAADAFATSVDRARPRVAGPTPARAASPAGRQPPRRGRPARGGRRLPRGRSGRLTAASLHLGELLAADGDVAAALAAYRKAIGAGDDDLAATAVYPILDLPQRRAPAPRTSPADRAATRRARAARSTSPSRLTAAARHARLTRATCGRAAHGTSPRRLACHRRARRGGRARDRGRRAARGAPARRPAPAAGGPRSPRSPTGSPTRHCPRRRLRLARLRRSRELYERAERSGDAGTSRSQAATELGDLLAAEGDAAARRRRTGARSVAARAPWAAVKLSRLRCARGGSRGRAAVARAASGARSEPRAAAAATLALADVHAATGRGATARRTYRDLLTCPDPDTAAAAACGCSPTRGTTHSTACWRRARVSRSRLARRLLDRGDIETAEDVLRRAAERPDDLYAPGAALALGDLLGGATDEGRAAYERALELGEPMGRSRGRGTTARPGRARCDRARPRPRRPRRAAPRPPARRHG